MSLLADPVRRGRSAGIDCLRGALALYVLFGHLLPWALYTTHTSTAFTQVNAWLIRVFQGHGETDPAVLGFIVLSGYYIHRNGLRADNTGTPSSREPCQPHASQLRDSTLPRSRRQSGQSIIAHQLAGLGVLRSSLAPGTRRTMAVRGATVR